MLMRKKGVKDDRPIMTVGNSKILSSEFYRGRPRRYSRRTLNLMNNLSARMSKTAALTGGSMGGMGGDVINSAPAFYHPEFEPDSLLLPKDYREINMWARYFYRYDSLTSTAIDCHAELPISTIRMTLPTGHDKKKNRAIQQEYEEMCSTEYLDLFNKLLQIGVEYYKLGNVFPFAQWSEKQKKWVRLTLLDPDFVEVDKLQFTNNMRIDLIPNDRLKSVVRNGAEDLKTGLLYKSVPEDIRELILANKKLSLNTDPNRGGHVAHIGYKMADYDTLGTGLIERNFKPLIYKHRLRQAQDAIAARHLTPKHLIWAESMGNMDVNSLREQVDNAFADPDYSIITNFEVHWELIGTGQGMMQLESEWNWINDELMIGLMINKSFLLGEGGYANGQTVLEVMNQRYSIYRERLESYIIHNLFLPMAKANDWAEYEPGTLKKEKKIIYLYPHIKWNRLNFVDDTQHKQMLSQMVTQGQIDLQTWLECFGLDAETIKERLKRFQGTPLDINWIDEQKSISSEVARILAPGIAKKRALTEGIELPKDDKAGGMMFADGSQYKLLKNASGENYLCEVSEGKLVRKAETREQRRVEREHRRRERKLEKNLETFDVPLKKNEKPPREDMRSPKLFPETSGDTIVVADFDKAQELAKVVEKEDFSKTTWIERMEKLGLDKNSRRVALVIEDDILSLNGSSSSENRANIIKKYLPQIFASKIKDSKISLMEKTERAKSEFANDISELSLKMDSMLSRTSESQEIKKIIRKQIEKAFVK